MHRHLAIAVALPLATLSIAARASASSAAALPEAPDFVRDVRPIFERHCYRCHGGRSEESGLRVDLRERFFAGGRSGRPPVVPGEAERSFLIELVTDTSEDYPRMPQLGEPLAPSEIDVLRRWIATGAEWPLETEADRVHWAYRKPQWPEIQWPEIQEPENQGPEIPAPERPAAYPGWDRHPIDALVLARLHEEGLEPSPEADPYRLLRRLHLDLTGLPPSPAEVESYLADTEPEAYERRVDELLASPAYGERWAQHWLDLARYADSNGYEKDRRRSMWPWRDWVIDALNRDLPFDQFVIEQVAGDLLPGASRDQVLATGFHRNSMLNEEGGIDPEEFHYEAIVDRLNTTFTVFLGTTIGCARCHDHKYDPFSQRDFYRLLAIFNSQQGDHREVNSYTYLAGGPRLYFPTPEQQARLERTAAAIDQLEESLGAPEAQRHQAREHFWRSLLPPLGPITSSLVMRELPHPRPTFIHRGGSFRSPGDRVEPGMPELFPQPPQGTRLDRLGLARWLVSPDNPLTARVTVNRIWEHYFGVGLVKTTEDFGTQGERPSHPRLLDWLALQLQWQGWSLKSLHKTIVTSATYRQAAVLSEDLRARDPDNRLLARGPRVRLSAETLRDQALAAAGLLATEVGGPSVFPSQPPGIWNMPYNSERWENSQGDGRFRRGLYTWWQRSATYPSFVNFDAPSRERTCARRSRTNTPLQALTALNDPVFVEAAQGLAHRVLREAPDDVDSRLELAFRLTVVRPPQPEELERLRRLLEEQLRDYRNRPDQAVALNSSGTLDPPSESDPAEVAAWTLVANVLLNLDETLTKG